jgi:hypothetical protein
MENQGRVEQVLDTGVFMVLLEGAFVSWAKQEPHVLRRVLAGEGETA